KGSSSVGAISYNAQDIKNRFFRVGHSLEEDVQKLVGTFNKVSEMSGAIASLKECSSSEEFLAQKNALLAKSQQARSEMSFQSIESNVGYSSGLCIIWQDYVSTFLTPYINSFSSDLNEQANEINNLSYEELKQLETLQVEQQKIKGQIEENHRQHQEAERNGDTQKAAELFQVIKNLKSRHEQVVNQIINNPWNKASEYDFARGIEQIMSVLEGQTNPDDSTPTGNRTNTNSNQSNNQNRTNSSGGTTNPTSTTPLNNFQNP
ncbi:11349_t:CDS:2, partial [Funneliformis geosporum]